VRPDRAENGAIARWRFYGSGWHIAFINLPGGLRKARQKGLATAAGMGATHVVRSALNAGGAVQTATGSAWRDVPVSTA